MSDDEITYGDPLPPVITHIITLEHSGPNAVSPKGARSRYQITKDTADHYGIDYGRLGNEEYAERSARRIAADLEKKYPKDEQAQLVAWNAGPGRANQWIKAGRTDEAIPPETRKYLDHSDRIGVEAPEGTFTYGKPSAAAPKPTTRATFQGVRSANLSSKPTGVQAAPASPVDQFIRDWGGYTADEYHRGAQANRELFKSPLDALNPLKVYEGAGNALAAILSPVAGVAQAAGVADHPALRDVGSDEYRRKIGDLATSLVPIGGGEVGAEKAGLKVATKAKALSENALRAAQRTVEKLRMASPEDAHNIHVKTLTDAGFDPKSFTPGQLKGGEAKRAEEAAKSKPTSSGPIRAQEQKSLRELNRTWYDTALKPVGQKFTGENVGHEGVAEVHDKIQAVYDRYLPMARGKIDKEFAEEVAEVRAKDNGLHGADQGVLTTVIDQHVLPRFQNGEITGESFKTVESELTKISTNFRGQGKILLADHVDDIVAALRSNIERNSPAGVRDKIKAANTSWAIYKRIESAASRRAIGDGIASAEDFLQAAKKLDKSKDKGLFARGQALTQPLASAGRKVLGNVVSDSGTAERGARNSRGIVGAMAGAAGGSHFGPLGAAAGAEIGGAADRAVGGVVTAAKRALMAREVESLARAHASRTPQNYLARISRSTSPLVNHRAAGGVIGGGNALRAVLSPEAQQP